MVRKVFEDNDEDSYVEEKKQKGQENGNLLSFSCYNTDVYSVYNPYQQVKVTGPKWTNEGG